MTNREIIEVAAAVAILVGGIWLYRRNRAVDRGYGSQGAVLLFAIAAILAIHGLGLMRYRPGAGTIEALKERAQ